jgi:hypothetical protein
MQLLERARDRRTEDTEATELEMYRFWHLDYGEVAYYDQLVFKRHQPIPPISDGTRTAGVSERSLLLP